MPSSHQTSKTPFPEKRVPRRGLVQVLPDDPDYERICNDQGLDHLIRGRRTPSMPNGMYSPSPTMPNNPIPRRPVVNGANGHGKGVITNGINGDLM